MPKRVRMALAGLCALLSVLACLAYTRAAVAQAAESRRSAIEGAGYDAVSVVVAARELDAGTRISRADVELVDWIGAYVPEGALTSLDACLDARLTSAVPAGSVVCDAHFRNSEQLEKVPAGYVAIGIQLTKNLGISASCAPGTAVIAYAAESSGTVALIAADARILSVSSAGSALSGETITLAVRPADVAALISATRSDSLRLVLPAEDISFIPDASGEASVAEELQGAPTEVLPVEDEPAEQESGSQAGEGE